MTTISSSEYRAMRKLSEKDITREVVSHWRARGVPGSLVASIPNAGAQGQYGLRKGLADLLVIAPGLPVGFLELKRVDGVLSEDQADFWQLCFMQGIPWEVAYGLDAAITALTSWGALR